MNLEYNLEVDQIGAVTITNDGTLLASYNDGSDFGVKAVDPDLKAQAVYEGLDFRSPIKNPERPTAWNKLELYHAPLPDGATIEVYYRVNKNGAFVRAKTANGDNAFTEADARKSTYMIGADGDIFEPKVVLTPIGNLDPEVHRIRTYFQ